MTDKIELDTTGLLCPMPVLKARQKLEIMKSGEVLVLTSTDTSSSYDVPDFCEQSGHKLIARRQMGRTFMFEILKCGEED